MPVLDTGEVGIGTVNPTAPLQINHGSPKILLEDNDNGADISIANVGGAAVYSSATDVVFQTADTSEKVRIASTGKVGIGSYSPDAWLHIQTTSTTGDEDIIKFSRNQYEVGKIRRSGGNMKVSGEGNLYLEADYNANHGATDSNIIFNVDDDEKARIKSNGYLGIGTVNPQSQLHVYDDSAAVYTKIESTSGAATLDLRQTNKYGSLNYYYQGTHKWLFGQVNQESDISLYQPTGVGAGEEPYRIVVKGNGLSLIHI